MAGNRLGKRRRDRIKAAQAKRDAIVAGNLSSPKPTEPKLVVQSSPDYLTRKGAHSFRSPLHEGRDIKVIAHKGFNLGRVGNVQGWNRLSDVEPVAPAQYPTRVKAGKRFAKDGYNDRD